MVKVKKSFLFILLVSISMSVFALPVDSEKVSSERPLPRISPSLILNRLEENLTGIKDLQAEMAFQIYIKKLGFPFTVHADYYFKVPDKVKIELRGIPGLLVGDAPKTVTAATTLTGFRKDYQTLYRAKLQGMRRFDGQSCYLLELTPNSSDGNVAKTFLWVNEQNYTIPQLITHYHDGSWIQVKRTYSIIQKHLLVQHIEATMDFVQSKLEADVKADYTTYKLNQGLKDTLFEDKK